ncbi:hypothetical protein [Roseibium alexandrii]|uniref:hypothetical protein n=1 Tax=Roseibium alexandrii TaxID=388408 RepID=UPI003750D143
MAKKPSNRKFEHIGSQRVDYFREKPQPKKKFDWDSLFGGLFLLFCVLVLLGSCTN